MKSHGLRTAHKFIEEMEALGVSLYWYAQRIEALLPAEMARSEREMLVDRINSGLARRKGKTLGRPQGSTLIQADFLADHKEVVKQQPRSHGMACSLRKRDKRVAISRTSSRRSTCPKSAIRFRLDRNGSGMDESVFPRQRNHHRFQSWVPAA